MRIAFILDETWDSALTHYAYGVFKSVWLLHKVKLFCLKDSYIDKKVGSDKIYIKNLRNKSVFKIISGLKSLSSAFETFNPDIVVTIRGDATFFSCLLKKRFKFKLVRIFGENKILRTPGDCIDGLLLPAEFLKSYIKKAVFPSLAVKGFVDTDKFRFSKEGRKKIRNCYGIDDEEILFGAVGRLDKIKGYPLLIKAFAHSGIDNAKIMIVGEEKAYKKGDLEDIADSFDIRDRIVIINERRQDIVDIMSAFDVGVISSIGSETIARVMFEFMALGLPVITSNVGMLKEIADDSFCIVAEANNEYSLADAMESMVSADMSSMRKKSQESASLYSFENFERQILSFFENLR